MFLFNEGFCDSDADPCDSSDGWQIAADPESGIKNKAL